MNNIPHDRKPHPHQHVIMAWAEGKKIQAYNGTSLGWEDCDHRIAPHFAPSCEYRIKPEPKPPYSRYAQVSRRNDDLHGNIVQSVSSLLEAPMDNDNVEFIFDGDTHQLIEVHVMYNSTHPQLTN